MDEKTEKSLCRPSGKSLTLLVKESTLKQRFLLMVLPLKLRLHIC